MVCGTSGRHTLSLGLFVVGQSDRDVIPLLIRKLGYRGGIRDRIIEQGEAFDAEAVSTHIRALLASHPDISKIIVCVDSECTDIEQSRKGAISTERNLVKSRAHPPVKYVIVDHSLEGWLLQDLDAVGSVLGTRAKLSLSGNPEDECRPAELLRKLFRTYSSQSFKKTVHNKKIASEMNIKVLQSRSPTFAYLVEALRAT